MGHYIVLGFGLSNASLFNAVSMMFIWKCTLNQNIFFSFFSALYHLNELSVNLGKISSICYWIPIIVMPPQYRQSFQFSITHHQNGPKIWEAQFILCWSWEKFIIWSEKKTNFINSYGRTKQPLTGKLELFASLVIRDSESFVSWCCLNTKKKGKGGGHSPLPLAS